MLASTANYLKSHGWQHGPGWGSGGPNFDVIKEWNKAEVYAKTIALFADKLNGGHEIKAENVPAAGKTATQPRRSARRL